MSDTPNTDPPTIAADTTRFNGELPEFYKDAVASDTEPADPTEGLLWYDTAGKYLKAYVDIGNGLEWLPSDPLRVTDEAVTFGESNVSVSLFGDGVVNGGVEVPPPASFEELPTTTNWSATFDNYTITSTAQNVFLSEVPVEKHPQANDTGVCSVEVLDTNQNTVAGPFSTNINSGVNTISFSESDYSRLFNPGESMVVSVGITADNSGSPNVYLSEYSTNLSSSGFELIDPDDPAGTRYLPCAETEGPKFGGDTASELSGGGVVNFDTPATSVVSWDLADYTKNVTDGTVTVDVEDRNGNVLLADIASQADISGIPSDTNIQFRISITTPAGATANNVDYLSQRYIS